jgi:hypothetical protein
MSLAPENDTRLTVLIREFTPGVWEILVNDVDVAGNVPRDDGVKITFKDGKAHVQLNLEPDHFEFEALEAQVDEETQ